MKTRISSPVSQWVERLLGQGRYSFTKQESLRSLRCSPESLSMALWRLARAKWVVMPRRGFYVIVDPQHRSVGTLPPEWFIHDLMMDLKVPYYVGLLSAAQFHGAAHQQPQVFQVMTPRQAIRPLHAGNVRIQFFRKTWFSRSATVDIKTQTGFMKVSSPETTAWDLIWFLRAAGGFDHVVTILSELSDKLDARRLFGLVKLHDEPVVAQRLGYILDRLGRTNLTAALAAWIKSAPVKWLDPTASLKRGEVNGKWHLRINASVEPEA